MKKYRASNSLLLTKVFSRSKHFNGVTLVFYDLTVVNNCRPHYVGKRVNRPQSCSWLFLVQIKTLHSVLSGWGIYNMLGYKV